MKKTCLTTDVDILTVVKSWGNFSPNGGSQKSEKQQEIKEKVSSRGQLPPQQQNTRVFSVKYFREAFCRMAKNLLAINF